MPRPRRSCPLRSVSRWCRRRLPAPPYRTGDILVTEFGGLIDGDSIDRIDPTTRARSRVVSVGIDDGPRAMAGAPNGDVYVADISGTVTRVDHATGATKVIRVDHDETFPIRDLAVDKDGSLLALLAEDQGTSLVRINSTTGALTRLSDDQLFSDPQDLAIEWDGRVVVTDRNRLIR